MASSVRNIHTKNYSSDPIFLKLQPKMSDMSSAAPCR